MGALRHDTMTGGGKRNAVAGEGAFNETYDFWVQTFLIAIIGRDDIDVMHSAREFNWRAPDSPM